MKIEESIACKENGYFTVEAALVLPIVLGVNLLIIYMLFFQYDRCLLEFDIGIVILRGVNLQTENKDELQRQINSLAKNIDWERYIAWETDKLYTKVEGTDITVQGSGRLCFPFGEIVVGEAGQFWQGMAKCKSQRINPTTILRSYRKLMNGE